MNRDGRIGTGASWHRNASLETSADELFSHQPDRLIIQRCSLFISHYFVSYGLPGGPPDERIWDIRWPFHTLTVSAHTTGRGGGGMNFSAGSGEWASHYTVLPVSHLDVLGDELNEE